MNMFKLFGLGALMIGATSSMAAAQPGYGYRGFSCGTGYSSGAYRTQPYFNSGAYGNSYGAFGGASVRSAPLGYQYGQPYAAPYAGGTAYRTGSTYDPVHGDYHSTPVVPQRPFPGYSGHSINPWSRW